MEIRHLKLIKEVAEKGSLTKAQDTLFLSQSALSHQLKEVESQLGASLFHRINKKLVLTGAGKIVLDSAEKILKELEKTEVSIKKYVGGDSGKIRLTTQCYTCYHWLPSLMIGYNKEFPNVELEIFHDGYEDTEKKLLDGSIDLALVSEKRDYPNLNYYELFEDEMVALVPSDHPWTKKKFVTASDFEEEHIIIHSYPLESVVVYRELLKPANITPKKIIQIQVTEAMIEMVKAGMGVKVIAHWIVRPYLKDKSLSFVPITKKGLHRKWYAVTLNEPSVEQYTLNFVNHLKCNLSNEGSTKLVG